MLALIGRLHLARWVLWGCLAVQLTSLATLAALNFLDERLEKVSFSIMLLGRVAIASTHYHLWLPMLAYLLILSLGLFAAGLFLSSTQQRSLRNLFVLTTMIALAMTLFTSWTRISWEGRRYHMKQRIESLQAVCDSLQRAWPKNDMDHELLGPLMAYPQWNPSTLILLTPMPIDDRFSIAAIDRSEQDILRFELSSGYETIWLEHRIDSSLDAEFTNGIEQSFKRQHFVALSPNWYLVRYQ